MPIAKEQVARMARLSGLSLTPSELSQFSRELSAVFDYIDCLAELDTDQVAPFTSISDGMRLREDVVRPSLPVGEALKNAPEKKDNCFIVPRVI